MLKPYKQTTHPNLHTAVEYPISEWYQFKILFKRTIRITARKQVEIKNILNYLKYIRNILFILEQLSNEANGPLFCRIDFWSGIL